MTAKINSIQFKLCVCVLIPLFILLIPTEHIPITALTTIQHRLLAIFILAALLWILEPVPVFATSVLIITLEVIMLSDQGLYFLRNEGAVNLGELIQYQTIFGSLASPIIVLFLGGFSLAIAASKYNLDNNLSCIMLRPFGEQPKFIMLGLMLVTAVFSMFMSNTATTVMMLSLVSPILLNLPKQDQGLKALVLSIPVAANTGGIATPIGTPPNAIALQYLAADNSISFLEWMSVGLPYVFIQLTLAWWLLQKLFPFTVSKIKMDYSNNFSWSWQTVVVYLTFFSTILLWLTTSLHGMNTYIVAIVPLAIFTLTGIIGTAELKLINWEVLWLVSGGIAIGIALEQTGLAAALATSFDYNGLDPFVIIVVFTLVCWILANFISNTAAANLLMPIAVAVSVSMIGVSIEVVLVVVAFAASLGMILPVSTPPNSLAYATGHIAVADMAKVGLILGLTGLSLLYFVVMFIV